MVFIINWFLSVFIQKRKRKEISNMFIAEEAIKSDVFQFKVKKKRRK